MQTSEPDIHRLVDVLKGNPQITVMTGAGISAASGIPTFRGAGGLWGQYSALDLASPQGFQRNPALVWEWYLARRQNILECHPNRGHEVLSLWSRRFQSFHLITQNVDGLHERAGNQDVIRFHGSIWEVGCWQECRNSPLRWPDENLSYPEIPPRCPYCGDWLRPGVVWFGEEIDPDVLIKADQATHCDVFMAVGTSALVYPAADLIHQARQLGALTVEINPEETLASSRLGLSIRGKAEVVLDQIEKLLTETRP